MQFPRPERRSLGTLSGYALWVRSLGTLSGYALWVRSLGTLAGHARWARSLGTLSGHALWACGRARGHQESNRGNRESGGSASSLLTGEGLWPECRTILS